MVRFILQRLAAAVPTLIAISLITFFMGYFAPGDPVSIMLGEKGTPAVIQRLKHEYGLDQPAWVQYGNYVWNALHGDLGKSYFYRDRPVSDIVGQGLPVSMKLALAAFAVQVVLGVGAGILAAVFKDSWIDRLSMLLAMVAVSVPSFVLALFLMIVVAVQLGWLPVAGWGQPAHYVLPAIVLGARSAAYTARLTRSSMLDVIRQDYIRTAFSKGVSRQRVILKHALRNAMIPVVTTLAISLGYLMTGSFIVETIFNIPGIGRSSIVSIFQRDYPVVQATTLLVAVIFVLMNLLVDMIYTWIDPRIQYS
ncbi:MAG: ABC transporter permease [Firmicutes bacterium]|nr:ABC transporter permease [Bacillota bacterium]